jgi:hypothetical protein
MNRINLLGYKIEILEVIGLELYFSRLSGIFLLFYFPKLVFPLLLFPFVISYFFSCTVSLSLIISYQHHSFHDHHLVRY